MKVRDLIKYLVNCGLNLDVKFLSQSGWTDFNEKNIARGDGTLIIDARDNSEISKLLEVNTQLKEQLDNQYAAIKGRWRSEVNQLKLNLDMMKCIIRDLKERELVYDTDWSKVTLALMEENEKLEKQIVRLRIKLNNYYVANQGDNHDSP